MTRAVRSRGFVLASACALIPTFALAVAFGSEPVSPWRAFVDPKSLDRVLMVDVRLPRVVLAAVAGAGLSAVGAAFQALLRNPLAEPYLLGVSGGAALGASLAMALDLGAILTGMTSLSSLVGLPLAAGIGGFVATMLVYGIGTRAPRGTSGNTILLAGVMVNSIAASAITFLKTMVSPARAQTLMRWLTGSIDVQSGAALAFVACCVVLGSACLVRDAGRLNLLALGDEPAASLGLDLRRIERRVLVAASCVVGSIVSVTGLIGFVGLVVPQAVRTVAGPDQRTVIPASVFLGANVLVACDLVARLSFRLLGSEPPVGAVTALLGGPIFLLMLVRSRRHEAA